MVGVAQQLVIVRQHSQYGVGQQGTVPHNEHRAEGQGQGPLQGRARLPAWAGGPLRPYHLHPRQPESGGNHGNVGLVLYPLYSEV